MKKTIENQRWVRVTKDNQLFFDESPEVVNSPNTKFWLNGKLRSTHKTKFENVFPLYDYEILDLNLESTFIVEDELSIISLSDEVVHSFQHSIMCRFKTANGDVHIESFKNDYDESANLKVVYKKAIDFLWKYRKCFSIREIQLMQANVSLVEDNQSLKDQAAHLKTEISELAVQNQKLSRKLKKAKTKINELKHESSVKDSDLADADN